MGVLPAGHEATRRTEQIPPLGLHVDVAIAVVTAICEPASPCDPCAPLQTYVVVSDPTTKAPVPLRAPSSVEPDPGGSDRDQAVPARIRRYR